MKRVRDFVVENYLYGDESRLKEDTSFIENGIIDSTGVVELASFLQETYQISIDDSEMIPENLDSLKNIQCYLEKKMTTSGMGK